MKQRGFTFILVILIILILGVTAYFGYKYFKPTNQLSAPLATVSPVPSSVFAVNPLNFSFDCPGGWTLSKNLDYGGKVETSECSLTYAGLYSFDDGGRLTMGFVPDSIPTSEKVYSDSQISTLKTFSNVSLYSNNGFEGWISMKNDSHTLRMVARLYIDGGYYEATALGVGDTKTDLEYKAIFDKMISSFSLNP